MRFIRFWESLEVIGHIGSTTSVACGSQAEFRPRGGKIRLRRLGIETQTHALSCRGPNNKTRALGPRIL